MLLAVFCRARKAWTGRTNEAGFFAGVAVRLHIDGCQLYAPAIGVLIGTSRQSFGNHGISSPVALREKVSNHLSLALARNRGTPDNREGRG